MEYVHVFGAKYVDLQHALSSFEVLSQISELNCNVDFIESDRSTVQHLMKMYYYQELWTFVMKCVNNQHHRQHSHQLHQH